MGMEPLTFILANDLDFLAGNAVKYVARGVFGETSTQRITDLEKARHYVELMIERERGDA